MDFRVWPHPKNRTKKKEAGLIYLAQPKADWGQTWPSLALSWAEQEGPKLEPSGSKLGPCWPKLTPSRANVADMPDRNGASGRFWTNLQNVQMTTITCTGQGGHGLKLYRSDRSVRFLSTPKLTRLGTFGVRIDLHFVWQAWHSWHWVGSGGALGPRWCHGCSFVWQAWHLEASTSILCGRRGTWCNCL